MLSELALLRQRVEEADGRAVAEAQARLAVEGKLSEAEGLASELARALSVMTAHCEELERQHEAQAAQAAMVEKATQDESFSSRDTPVNSGFSGFSTG